MYIIFYSLLQCVTLVVNAMNTQDIRLGDVIIRNCSDRALGKNIFCDTSFGALIAMELE